MYIELDRMSSKMQVDISANLSRTDCLQKLERKTQMGGGRRGGD